MEALAIHVSGVPVGYELRLDYLQDFSQLESQLHQMLMRLHFPQTIATCRMAAAGGMLQGTLADQAAILSAAVRAGCQWVDVEIESVQKGGVALLKELRPAKIIVSYHDFQKTPALAADLSPPGASAGAGGEDRHAGALPARQPANSPAAQGPSAAQPAAGGAGHGRLGNPLAAALPAVGIGVHLRVAAQPFSRRGGANSRGSHALGLPGGAPRQPHATLRSAGLARFHVPFAGHAERGLSGQARERGFPALPNQQTGGLPRLRARAWNCKDSP